jgi:protein-S-isoprenylcysteine O-methyltransferase Ste14
VVYVDAAFLCSRGVVAADFSGGGDWGWLEGWLLVITFAVNIGISYLYINRVNPRVIRNRMKVKKVGLTEETRKPAGSDWYLTPIMTVGFFGALILPGLAHRWGWTAIPLPIELVGLVLMNLGLVVMNLAILQNPFASKFLDINEDQYLVDSGLYAKVRHPLYAGVIILVLGIPSALGSWWAFIPAIFGALTFLVRIKYEEEMLVKGMAGYQAYQERVKYKLFPGVY